MFFSAVKQKYLIIAVMEDDKPISQYVVMIKDCEAVGRKDLADQIRMYWRKFLNKYPKYRIGDQKAWAAAAKHAQASIKVHLFNGKEFMVWLKEQEKVTPDQVKDLEKVPPITMPKDMPAIAIPKNDETQEAWLEEAERTKKALVAAKAAFSEAGEYIKYLEKEAGNIRQMIERNTGKKNKDGSPAKLSERIPKWKTQLEATLNVLEETKKSLAETEKQFKEAVNDYNHSPIITVAFEKKAQDSVENVLEYILDMKDLKKQKELLAKLNEAMKNDKVTASADEVTAAGDRFMSMFSKIINGFKAMKSWLSGLNKSVNAFSKLAAMKI